jgi:hypothetical protein
VKRRLVIGATMGLAAGIADALPMALNDLGTAAIVSVVVQWVVTGMLVSSSRLPLGGILRGAVIATLVALPHAVLSGWSEPLDAATQCGTALVLGALMGFVIDPGGAPEGGRC